MSTESLQSLRTGLAGRYTIEREVGRGGMATVYLARDVRHGRQVAVKVLDPELGAILGAERFLAEINVTANLQHPNLLPLFDSGEVEGLLFYVMPFVDGESLRQRLDREGQLPIDEAIHLATSVANALDYAHGRGVIHRDLKPENILLQAGQPVVADFGIALAVSKAGGARATATGLSLGTPQYMSPEQAGGGRAIDRRTDIYSLGAVTYEMLTGEPPHSGPTAQAVVAKLMTEDVRPLTVVRRSVPAHVDRAVRRALEKLPADRFGTALEFSAALHDGSSVPNVLDASHTPVASWPRWRSTFAVAVALGGVAAGALGAWALSRARPGRAAGALEPRYYSIALPDSAPLIAGRDYLGNGTLSIAISRDGGAVVYTADTPAGERLVLVPLDGRGVRVLPGTVNGHLPTFSPDGRSIAFVVGDTLVMRASLDGGSVTPVARTSDPVSLEWLDDKIYISGPPTVAPASGGVAQPFPNSPSWQAWTETSLSRYGPTSDWLLAGGNNLFLIRSTDGAQRPLVLPNDTANARRGSRGSSPRLVGSRYLLFARDSVLFAAGFDSARARFLTSPVAVLSGVRAEQRRQSQRALADDGTLVWASGSYERLGQFVWASPDGTVRDTVPVPPADVQSFTLSADGSRLAFSRYNSDGALELAVADLERRIVDVIPLPLPVSPSSWVNRGQDLAVGYWRADNSVALGLVRLSTTPARLDTTTSFSADSRDGLKRCRDGQITQGDPALIVWRAADSLQLARNSAWCRFSPDARLLAWTTSRGNGGLFVASTEGAFRGRRVQLAPSGADEPRWSADGRTVIYRSGNRWFAVPTPTADLKPAGSPRLLFEGPYLQAASSWDLAPDGRLLLLKGQPPLRTTRLNVITNFGELVRRKLEGSARSR